MAASCAEVEYCILYDYRTLYGHVLLLPTVSLMWNSIAFVYLLFCLVPVHV